MKQTQNKDTTKSKSSIIKKTFICVIISLFWSNIGCAVKESALSRRGDGAQGSRQGAADG